MITYAKAWQQAAQDPTEDRLPATQPITQPGEPADRQYQSAWQDATTNPNWVKQEAAKIMAELNGGETAGVLRRAGRSRVVPKTVAAEAADGTSGGRTAAAGSRADGGNDGGSDGGSNAGGGTQSGSHSGTNSIGNTGIGSTLGGLIGTAIGGPLGGRIGSGLGDKAETALGRMSPVGVADYGVPGLDGTTTEATGPGTIGSRDSYGSNESSGNLGGGPTGDVGGGYGGTQGSGDSATDSSSGDSSSSGGGTDSGNSGSNGDGYYKGGMVARSRLSGPDPKGPDDGHAGLDVGEFVVRKSAVKKYGQALFEHLNKGTLTAEMLQKLLKDK